MVTLHIEKHYEDYEFPEYILKLMLDNGFIDYAEKYCTREDFEILLNTDLDECKIFWCGKDESYAYDLFEPDGTNYFITDNNQDNTSPYICDKGKLFEYYIDKAISEIRAKNELLKNVIPIEYSFDYGNGLYSGVFTFLWEGELEAYYSKKISKDRLEDFEQWVREETGEEDNIPGIVFDDVSTGGGGYDGTYYDIYIEKDSIAKAKEYIKEIADSVIEEFLK